MERSTRKTRMRTGVQVPSVKGQSVHACNPSAVRAENRPARAGWPPA